MKFFLPLAAISLLVVAGCQNKTAQLVGKWKALPAPTSSNNPGDAMRGSMQNLWTQNMILEFNDKGTFKISNFTGQGTGDYRWEGDTLILKFNTLAPVPELRFKMNGNKLEQDAEFSSDVSLSFEKQP